jgi:hypothetical protein
MAYVIEIRRLDVSYNDEDGNPLDGDWRMISDHGTSTDEFDPEFADEDTPVTWAAEQINKTDAFQPSTDPIPDEIGDNEWLSGTHEDGYGRWTEETTVRLSGDWTPRERSEVFRKVYMLAFPYCKTYA